MSDQTDDSGVIAEKRLRKPRTPRTPDIETPATPAADRPAPAPAAAAAVSAPPAPATIQPAGDGNAQPAGNDGGEPRQGSDQGEGHRGNRRERFRNRRDRGGGGGGGGRPRDDGMPNDSGNGENFVPRPHPNVPEGFPQYSLGDLKRMPAQKLLDIAEQLNISEGVARARKQDVIFALLKVLTRHGEGVAADGVLEILPDGFG
ncbi:MAG: Rho termination factor N-terminal domain-containing protein, partial [Gammaproteobacteria bacterium]|nr:Rho termination factor N-terminal domain-containing protein [Gammaproteobacteria bacterium]